MSGNFRSIENLIISSGQSDDSDDTSPSSQFTKKQREIKVKEMERLTEQTAGAAGLPYINLFGFPVSPEAISLISEDESLRLKTICFYYDGKNIRIGTTEIPNEEIVNLVNVLSEKYYCEVAIYLISEVSFVHVMNFYKTLPKIKKTIDGLDIKVEDLEKFKTEIFDYRLLNEKINHVNISDVVTLMVAIALKTDSSDIHIEAEDQGIVFRLRIDGVLQEIAVIEKEKWKKIISRMKLISRVKLNIEGKPQDGRFTIYLSDEKIEVRCSFLPTSYGESVVMRLLRSSAVSLNFENLGIRAEQFEILNREIKKPNGLILSTGPTGSGKTTTLYAILNKLNSKDTKIITLEDPVEYKLKGINQSQIDVSKDYTFAKGLRSILRQDPDIVMVGEMRDFETAEIAVQASLTGHLVLSTLHTNDAAGVIPRLVDMGVKPFFLVPSINCIIGQRLVRLLCPKCKTEHEINDKESHVVKKILSVISPKSNVEVPINLPKIYKAGAGCESCSGTGYKGRIGIYEIFTMDNSIKELTMNSAPAFKILEQAIENGMITMLQDGVLKCLEGKTSLEEVYRVIGKFDYIDALYDIVVSNTIGRGISISEVELAKGEELAKDLLSIGNFLVAVPTSQMMGYVVSTALKTDAGDIHIDPTENGVSIRFRIDGILHDIIELSKEHYIPLISQIKTLAGFALNIKKPTYDGRFAIFLFDGTKMDCRLSIISGGYGEAVVIRILSSQASALDMKKLGIRTTSLAALTNSITKTKGIVITTGPTGSGKTTTLYSILNQLNNRDIKIITIEDPIEYHLEGVMQTQIDSEHGYTFAAALRSLMRQNPNIIMIGEIRDEETAKITIEAAQTGHLVLSTIHSNSAAGAISRFVGLGVDRQALVSSMECSIGQRLVRQICPYCKVEDNISEANLAEVKTILGQINPKSGVEIPKIMKFFKGKGCEKCSNIGYKGRVGIYEVIVMTPDIQKVIQTANITDFEIEQAAIKNGTLLMLQDGIMKALNGETSVEEVFRVAK